MGHDFLRKSRPIRHEKRHFSGTCPRALFIKYQPAQPPGILPFIKEGPEMTEFHLIASSASAGLALQRVPFVRQPPDAGTGPCGHSVRAVF